MYTTIITFYVSLAGIFAMLLMKRAEMRTSKKSILSRMGQGSDHIIRSNYHGIRWILSHINTHNAIVAVQWLAFHILSGIRTFFRYLQELAHRHPHSKKVIDMVNGKGEVHQKGGASFYLKRIGEEGKK